MSNEFLRYSLNINRRTFLSSASVGIGSLALGSLLVPDLFRGKSDDEEALPFGVTHFAPKAKTSNLFVSKWSAFTIRTL